MKNIRDILRSNSLLKYLKSQVGRPWNQVFSEICSKADCRSKKGHDVRDFIKWNVSTDCVVTDKGIFCYSGRWLGMRPVTGLYVHPETGILCYEDRNNTRVRWDKPHPWERDINFIRLDDGSFFIKNENGLWFKHWFTKKTVTVYDLRSSELIQKEIQEEHKRQLNHKEIKNLKSLYPKGTNKEFYDRLRGEYIPSYKW